MGGVATKTLHAAIYSLSSGSITDFGTWAAQKPNKGNSDSGLAVGFADTPTTSHAFLYNINTGVLTDLGTWARRRWYSDAAGVNDLGQVVGGYYIDRAGLRCRIYLYPSHGMQNLNDLIAHRLDGTLTAA